MAWTFYNASGEAMIEDGAAIAATQAEMETATATGDAAFVTPGRTHFHPGVAKFWIEYTSVSTTAATASYNITGVADQGTGDTIITIATDFSGVAWAAAAMVGGEWFITAAHAANKAAGTIRAQTYNESASATDSSQNSVVGFGDQA